MQLKLSEAGPQAPGYHDHGITGDQGAHGAGHAAKLGIVKLGKVAGKVRDKSPFAQLKPWKTPLIVH